MSPPKNSTKSNKIGTLGGFVSSSRGVSNKFAGVPRFFGV